jgi:hypothetical protein
MCITTFECRSKELENFIVSNSFHLGIFVEKNFLHQAFMNILVCVSMLFFSECNNFSERYFFLQII